MTTNNNIPEGTMSENKDSSLIQQFNKTRYKVIAGLTTAAFVVGGATYGLNVASENWAQNASEFQNQRQKMADEIPKPVKNGCDKNSGHKQDFPALSLAWAPESIDDLVATSDVIIVGYVVGPADKQTNNIEKNAKKGTALQGPTCEVMNIKAIKGKMNRLDKLRVNEGAQWTDIAPLRSGNYYIFFLREDTNGSYTIFYPGSVYAQAEVSEPHITLNNTLFMPINNNYINDILPSSITVDELSQILDTDPISTFKKSKTEASIVDKKKIDG